jgi:ABC-type uncharacterized transport system permease subunit
VLQALIILSASPKDLDMDEATLIFQLAASTFRVSTPLIFAARRMVSERSGVVNIAL